MYNRYIPNENGVYRMHTVQEPKTSELPECQPLEPTAPQKPIKQQKTHLFSGLEPGDLLLLCIILLIAMENGEEDLQSMLITAAAFLFMQ